MNVTFKFTIAQVEDIIRNYLASKYNMPTKRSTGYLVDGVQIETNFVWSPDMLEISCTEAERGEISKQGEAFQIGSFINGEHHESE